MGVTNEGGGAHYEVELLDEEESSFMKREVATMMETGMVHGGYFRSLPFYHNAIPNCITVQLF